MASLSDVVSVLQTQTKKIEDTNTGIDKLTSVIQKQLDEQRSRAGDELEASIRARRGVKSAAGQSAKLSSSKQNIPGIGGIAGILASGGLALGAIGLGLGGFFAGLAAGSAGVDYMNTDGAKLKTLMINVGEGLSGIAPALNQLDAGTWAALLGSALFTTLRGPIGQIKTATGLTALGFGVGGFFAGLAAGEGAIIAMENFLGSQLTGSNLKDIMSTLGDALNSFSLSKEQAIALGTLTAATGVAAFLAPGKTTLGIGALGAGIGIFFTALATADAAMSWLSGPASKSGSNLSAMMKNLSDALASFTLTETQAKTVAGVAATALFVPGKTVIALAALGTGIGIFFTSLAAADAAMSWLSGPAATGTNLTTMMGNLSAALAAFDLSEAQAQALGAVALTSLFAPGKTALGMSAIGAGIAGFFGSLAFGDWATGKLGGGTKLRLIMENLATGLKAFDPTHLAGLTGLFAVGAIFGALPGGALLSGKVAIGMAAVGLGIGGFLSGIAVGDKLIDLLAGKGTPGESIKDLLVNTAKGVKEFTTIDYKKLEGSGSALRGLGGGLVAFFGGQAAGGLLDTISAFAEGATDAFKKGLDFLFGTNYSGGKQTIFQKIISDIKPLADGSADLEASASGLGKLTTALDNFYTSFARFGSTKSTDSFSRNLARMVQDIGYTLEILPHLLSGEPYDLDKGFNAWARGIFGSRKQITFGDGLRQFVQTGQGDVEVLARGVKMLRDALAPEMTPVLNSAPTTPILSSPADRNPPPIVFREGDRIDNSTHTRTTSNSESSRSPINATATTKLVVRGGGRYLGAY